MRTVGPSWARPRDPPHRRTQARRRRLPVRPPATRTGAWRPFEPLWDLLVTCSLPTGRTGVTGDGMGSLRSPDQVFSPHGPRSRVPMAVPRASRSHVIPKRQEAGLKRWGLATAPWLLDPLPRPFGLPGRPPLGGRSPRENVSRNPGLLNVQFSDGSVAEPDGEHVPNPGLPNSPALAEKRHGVLCYPQRLLRKPWAPHSFLPPDMASRTMRSASSMARASSSVTSSWLNPARWQIP